MYLITRPFAVLGYVLYALRHRHVSFSEMALHWDGWWYVHIAQHGYSRSLRPPLPRIGDIHHDFSDWAFFPAYPLSIRYLHDVTMLPYLTAALLLAFGFGLLAVRAMYALGEVYGGTHVAQGSALLIAAWPGTAAFTQPYSEGLFIAVAAGSLVMLYRGHWVTAGLLGALASATRPTGLALVAAAGVIALVRLFRNREIKPFIAPVLAVTGMLSFLVYGWLRTGDLLVWRHSENLWKQNFDLSRSLLLQWLHLAQRLDQAATSLKVQWLVATDGLEMACSLVLIGFLVAAWMRRRRLTLPLGVYAAVTLVMIVGYSDVATRPRMLLAFLPGFVWAASVLPRRATWVLAALLTPILTVVTYLWLWKVVP